MIIKSLLKNLLRQFGYKISKIRQPSSHQQFGIRDLESLEALNDAKGVLHLGAHKGNEAEVYSWFGKKVFWVEAIPYIYNQLKDNIHPYKNQKAVCALLGDRDNLEKKFYISSNDAASSSIYEFSANTLNGKYFPKRKLKMHKSVLLKTSKLDTILEKNNILASEYDHWVVDLQGAELLALKGAEKSLKYCKSMSIEVSTVEIYQGGVLWAELKEWLNERNFYSITEPNNIHADILFKKNIKFKK